MGPCDSQTLSCIDYRSKCRHTIINLSFRRIYLVNDEITNLIDLIIHTLNGLGLAANILDRFKLRIKMHQR